jgi:hypothetical protein
VSDERSNPSAEVSPWSSFAILDNHSSHRRPSPFITKPIATYIMDKLNGASTITKPSTTINDDTEVAPATGTLLLSSGTHFSNAQDNTSGPNHSSDSPANEVNQSSSDTDTKHTILESLGLINTCIIMGGAISSIAALSFLIFL